MSSMSSMNDPKTLSRRFYQAYDRNDRDGLAALLAVSCVVHLPGAPGLSRDAFLAVSALFADAFSDSVTTFVAQVAEGDTAMTRWTWDITHTGEFQGIPATGKRISLDGVTMNRVAGAVIVEQWVSFDRHSLLQQLGVIP